MPQIYTSPFQINSITDSQVSGANTIGSLSNISDDSKYTFYETDSAGTGNVLTFVFNLASTQDIDTVYLIGENIDSVRITEFGLDYVTSSTYNDRDAFIATNATTVSGTTITLECTRTPSTTSMRLYQVLIMRHLLSLNQSDTRAITRFDTTREIRNSTIQEDLYGSRTLQVGHINNTKKTIGYEMWQNASNLSACRSELNTVYNIQRQNSNFTIWDLSELGSQDYESVFEAFWIPGSFTERLQGTQAISYSFSIQEK